MGVPYANVPRLLGFVEIVTVVMAVTICYNNKRSEATRERKIAMNNIDATIKKMNTASILLDAFGDGREFTMHDYEELTATVNELFSSCYSEDNPCYSVGWLREHYFAFGIEKVGSREVEVISSYNVYKPSYIDYFRGCCNGTKVETKTVKQFIYRMNNAQGCSNVINHYKEEIRCEVDRVTARIECDKQRLEALKKML